MRQKHDTPCTLGERGKAMTQAFARAFARARTAEAAEHVARGPRVNVGRRRASGPRP